MQILYFKLKILEGRYASAVAAQQQVLLEERDFLEQLSSKYQKPFQVSILES